MFLILQMKLFFYISIFLSASIVYGQKEDTSSTNTKQIPADSIHVDLALESFTYLDPVTQRRIKYLTKKVKTVYPYAAYAADVYTDLEEETENLERNWKIKRAAKDIHDELEENFKYALRDMTRSEGRLLMTLVHHFTGETVYDIMAKYRGKMKADFWNLTSKIWDQNLKIEYDAEEDWMLEIILKRIENGEVEVDDNPEVITKSDYKKIKKERKESKKERHKRWKAAKKKRKRLKKEKEKAQKLVEKQRKENNKK